MPDMDVAIPRKPLRNEGNIAYRKRVPSYLNPDDRRDMVSSLRAGRNVHQVAWDKSCSGDVVLEVWLRAELHRINSRLEYIEDAMRRAA